MALKPRGISQAKDIFNQSAASAFKSTAFPPRTADENYLRGMASIDKLITQVLQGRGRAVYNAMHRAEVGAIRFHWGAVGKGNNLDGGWGLSKIVAKHGPEVLEGVIEALAKGKFTPHPSIPTRMEIRHEGHLVIVDTVAGRNRQSPTWIVTGYKPGQGSVKHFDLSSIRGPLFFSN